MTFRRYYPTPASKSESRFPDRRDAAFMRWVRTLPCCVSGVRSGELIEVPFPGGKTGKVRAIIEATHVRSRGAAGDDVGNVVPLEMSKHREQHKAGIKTFQRTYGVDLREIALDLAAQWRTLHPECAAVSSDTKERT